MSCSFAQRHRRREQSDRHQKRQVVRAKECFVAGLPTFEQLISAQNLRTSLELLHDVGGYKAGGPDGVRYCDLSVSDICRIARELHVALRDGAWEPSIAKHVRIPKGNDKFRTLLIRSIVTQIVAKTVNRLISPFWETIYSATSYGFRAGRSVSDFWLELERRIVQESCWCIVQDDIRRAFDNVSIELAMEDHERHITDARPLRLIRQLLTGHSSEQRLVGTDQGSAYSPTNLNTHLHYRLDTPLNAVVANPGLMRYVDDLVVPARTVSEGEETIRRTAVLLADVGLGLKGEDPAVDLSQGGVANVLGIQIRAEAGKVRYDLGETAWGRLNDLLAEAREMENPVRNATEAIQGWIAAYGPALADARRKQLLERILGVAADYGIVEISPSRVMAALQAAGDTWKALRITHGLAMGG